jgi:glutathione synthase/RimK-type ligase-like ATP-grasp enzyme
MSVLIVTNRPDDWPATIPGVEVVDDTTYLTDSKFSERRGIKVFNLCRSYRYQTSGYYVSLLAEARGHKPLPSVATVRDLKSKSVVRMVSDEIDELIQSSLQSLKSAEFELSIYFGQNIAARYQKLALALYNQFQSPMLRAYFSTGGRSRWQLRKVDSISGNEVPPHHWEFVIQSATEFFANRRTQTRRRTAPRFDLAILRSPNDPQPPSNDKAIKKFVRAAEAVGMSAEIITKDDYGKIAQFDGLFIRDTTYIENHTYRFARKAEGEGLIVMDDPQSILRCTNKVYLAELMARHGVAIPRTIVAHEGNARDIGTTLGFPVVLKRPDSAFSQGVIKVKDQQELEQQLEKFLEDSDLVVAQEFLPTTFDWRIGVLDQQPLFACKYFMARGHWQIINHGDNGSDHYGRFETVPVDFAPRKAVQLAVKAAGLIGDGLYGVDVKESNGKFYIIEVNDNPNVEAGIEDEVLKDDLYHRVMSVFLRRIEQRKSLHY